MTEKQKAVAWLGLILVGLAVVSNGEWAVILGNGGIACFLLCLAYHLNSKGKDGYSVFVVLAVGFGAKLFPATFKAFASGLTVLAVYAGAVGGPFAAAAVLKRSQDYPVLTFCVVLIAYYAVYYELTKQYW